MAGYTEALASVLYPNTNDESAFYLGGQGISQMRLPQFESPWQNFLAAGLQNLVGLGMKGYGARLTNQANAENAAQMIPQLGNLGVSHARNSIWFNQHRSPKACPSACAHRATNDCSRQQSKERC